MRLRPIFAVLVLAASTALAQDAAPAPAAAAPAGTPIVGAPGRKPLSHKQAIQADDAYLAGSALLAKNQPEKAQKAFERAAQLNPDEPKYALAATIAREHVVSGLVRRSELMLAAGNRAGSDALLAQATRLDPTNNIVLQHTQRAMMPEIDIRPLNPGDEHFVQPRYLPVTEFAPEDKPQNFHFRADAHEAIRRILLAYGLKTQFSSDVPSKSVRIDIEDASFAQIVDVLTTMTGAFITPIDAKTALVLKDTEDNHTQYDHLALEQIYMPGFSNDQMQETTTMLKQVLDIDKVVPDQSSGTITIRAPLPMLKLANYELADLLDGGNELLLDLKVYSVDRTNERNIGLTLGTSVSAFAIFPEIQNALNQYSSQIQTAIANGLIPSTATPIQIFGYLLGAGLLSSSDTSLVNGLLGTFGGGKTYTGVSTASLPSLNFGLNQSEAKTLEETQLAVFDRKTATFRIGTKYPIVTASYSAGGVSASALAGLTSAQLAALGYPNASAALASSQASIPQIQYEDLGLTLKTVPTVLRNGNVSLQLDLKIEALAGSTLNSIPILASRTLTSNVTVPVGESAMLVTSLTRQETNAVNGLPGLGELPGFQDAVADSDKSYDISELVITITPRLVRRARFHLANVPLLFPHGIKAANTDE